jgi:tRNA (cmo5U34)-methyltransferase
MQHAAQIQQSMWERWRYLASVKDEQYRDHVFDYIEQEDTPRSLAFQLELLRAVGFHEIEVLHKNNCFGWRPERRAHDRLY